MVDGSGRDRRRSAVPGKATLDWTTAGIALPPRLRTRDAIKLVGDQDDKPAEPRLREDKAGSFELQRILQRDSIALVGAAYEALVGAARARVPDQEVDTLSFSADGVDHPIRAASQVTDAMIPAFHARRAALARLPTDPRWMLFAAAFNQELELILHVFDLGEVRDDTRKEDVIAERLQYLFTERQRDLLMSYFVTRMIPERLFDGDEVGRATAQQRILIAGRILADGTYQPGSRVQGIHARSCSHWVHIVYQYAGVTTKVLNQGILGNFDPLGGVVLGHGALEPVMGRSSDPGLSPSEEHLDSRLDAVRDANAPWHTVRSLEPADWLDIYTGNATRSGSHSVIFAGWRDEEKFDAVARKHYRAAWTLEQLEPATGGRMQPRILGEDLFEPASGGTARPVNRIVRADPDHTPLDTLILDEKIANAIGAHNERVIEQMLRDKAKTHLFDKVALIAWLRGRNADFIRALVSRKGRLTEGQVQMCHAANASKQDADVIRLYQRLYVLVHNSEQLDENMAAHVATVDAKNGPADDRCRAALARLNYEILSRRIELVSVRWDADELRDRIEELANVEQIAALKRERKLRAKDGDAELHAIDARLAAVKKEAREEKPLIRELVRQLEPLRRREKQLRSEIARRTTELDTLRGGTELVWVGTGSSKGEIETQTVDGFYNHTPGVPWSDFIRTK
jgi:hypothetical protein